jgi:hypothetical protein
VSLVEQQFSAKFNGNNDLAIFQFGPFEQSQTKVLRDKQFSTVIIYS